LIWRMLLRDTKRIASLILVLLLLAASMPSIIATSDQGYQDMLIEHLRLVAPSLEIGVYWLDGPGYPDPIQAAGKYRGLWERFQARYPGSENLDRVYGGIMLVQSYLVHLGVLDREVIQYGSQNIGVQIEIRYSPNLTSPSGLELTKPGRYETTISRTLYDEINQTGNTTYYRLIVEPYWLLAPFGDPSEWNVEFVEGGMPEPGMDPIGVALAPALADYYGVGVGDEVTIGGVKFRVTGIFEHNGRISFSGGYYRYDGVYLGFIAHPDDIPRIIEEQYNYYISHREEALLSLSGIIILQEPVFGGDLLDWLVGTYGTGTWILGGPVWTLYNKDQVASLLYEYMLSDPYWYDFFNKTLTARQMFEEDTNLTIEDVAREYISGYVHIAANNGLTWYFLAVGADFSPLVVRDIPRGVDPNIYLEMVARNESLKILEAMADGTVEWGAPVPEDGVPTLYPQLPVEWNFRIGDDVYGAAFNHDLSLSMTDIGRLMTMSILLLPALVILLAVVAGRTAFETASIIVRDYRPFLAMIIARGMNPGKLSWSLSMLVIVLSLIVGLIGGLLGIQFINTFGIRTFASFSALLASGVVSSLMVGFYISYSALRQVKSISPVEAVRPVSSISAAYSRLGRRVGALLLLALNSVVLGFVFHRLDDIVGEAPNYIVFILFIVVMLGVMMAPIAPATLAHYTAVLLGRTERLYRASARVASRVAGRLAPISLSSSMSLRWRISSNVAAMSLAFGAALGAALAHAVVVDYVAQLQVLARQGELSTYQLGSVAAMISVSRMLPIVAVFTLLIGVIATLASMMSTFRLLEGEVVVLRARGASKSDAARFVYGMLAPVGLYTLLVALVVSLVLTVTFESLMSFETSELLASVESLSLPVPRPGILFLEVLAGVVAVLALAPVLVSQGVIRRRDIARLLRKGRFGW